MQSRFYLLWSKKKFCLEKNQSLKYFIDNLVHYLSVNYNSPAKIRKNKPQPISVSCDKSPLNVSKGFLLKIRKSGSFLICFLF